MAKKANLKLAKTASTKAKTGKACPDCGEPMIATRYVGKGSKMIWVCACGYREPVR